MEVDKEHPTYKKAFTQAVSHFLLGHKSSYAMALHARADEGTYDFLFGHGYRDGMVFMENNYHG